MRYLSLIFLTESSDRSPSIGYQSKVRVVDRYKVIGFISSGTYGRVYKAVGRNSQAGEFAIKKFKPGEHPPKTLTYTVILIINQRQGRRANPVHGNIPVRRSRDGLMLRAESFKCHPAGRNYLGR
jgi:hypothetical protein